ncbi:hypothetical protein RKD18_007879 [Streptomyces phaeoluteigriseus]
MFTDIRRIACTTNAIESVNARIRRALKVRGHSPNEQAALNCVYMAIMPLSPTGKGRAPLNHVLEDRTERLETPGAPMSSKRVRSSVRSLSVWLTSTTRTRGRSGTALLLLAS